MDKRLFLEFIKQDKFLMDRIATTHKLLVDAKNINQMKSAMTEIIQQYPITLNFTIELEQVYQDFLTMIDYTTDNVSNCIKFPKKFETEHSEAKFNQLINDLINNLNTIKLQRDLLQSTIAQAPLVQNQNRNMLKLLTKVNSSLLSTKTVKEYLNEYSHLSKEDQKIIARNASLRNETSHQIKLLKDLPRAKKWIKKFKDLSTEEILYTPTDTHVLETESIIKFAIIYLRKHTPFKKTRTNRFCQKILAKYRDQKNKKLNYFLTVQKLDKEMAETYAENYAFRNAIHKIKRVCPDFTLGKVLKTVIGRHRKSLSNHNYSKLEPYFNQIRVIYNNKGKEKSMSIKYIRNTFYKVKKAHLQKYESLGLVSEHAHLLAEARATESALRMLFEKFPQLKMNRDDITSLRYYLKAELNANKRALINCINNNVFEMNLSHFYKIVLLLKAYYIVSAKSSYQLRIGKKHIERFQALKPIVEKAFYYILTLDCIYNMATISSVYLTHFTGLNQVNNKRKTLRVKIKKNKELSPDEEILKAGTMDLDLDIFLNSRRDRDTQLFYLKKLAPIAQTFAKVAYKAFFTAKSNKIAKKEVIKDLHKSDVNNWI